MLNLFGNLHENFLYWKKNMRDNPRVIMNIN